MKITSPLTLTAIVVTFVGLFSVFAAHASAGPDNLTDYAEYRNEEWHYSLLVPAGMVATQFDEQDGSQIVMFDDSNSAKTFLIGAWPYTQFDLTLDREGEADPAQGQPDHLEIVDVVRDDRLRATFKKGGVTYSVMTGYREDEQWFFDMLKTWQFI